MCGWKQPVYLPSYFWAAIDYQVFQGNQKPQREMLLASVVSSGNTAFKKKKNNVKDTRYVCETSLGNIPSKFIK